MKFKLLNLPPRLFSLGYSGKMSSLVTLLCLHFDISFRRAAFWNNFDVNIRITWSQDSSLVYLSIRLYNSCRRLPETKSHSSLFLTDLVLNFLLSWLLVLLPSTFFMDVLFSFSPVVSIP